jgi:hypothetical protein
MKRSTDINIPPQHLEALQRGQARSALQVTHQLNMNVGAIVYIAAEVDGVPVKAGDRGCVRAVNQNTLTVDFTTDSDSMLFDVAPHHLLPRHLFVRSVLAAVHHATFKIEARFGSVYHLSSSELKAQLVEYGLLPRTASDCCGLLVGACAIRGRRISTTEWLTEIKLFYSKP